MNGPSLYLWLIPLLPFAGFLINGIFGARLPKWVVTAVALLAPLASFAIGAECRVGGEGTARFFRMPRASSTVGSMRARCTSTSASSSISFHWSCCW